jgi:riboflavin synthase
VFTGLIEALGEVSAVSLDGEGMVLEVRSELAGQMAAGDSVAIAGVCLTASAVGTEGFQAQAMDETLRCTTLGALEPGRRVNLELALRAGARLGGHLVQGHVDGVGTVTSAHEEGFARELCVQPDPELLPYLVHKGSIAIDGVSLTVSRLGGSDFCVSLIPETLQRTTLGRVGVGDRVNLEVDILAKHVARLLQMQGRDGRHAEGSEP